MSLCLLNTFQGCSFRRIPDQQMPISQIHTEIRISGLRFACSQTFTPHPTTTFTKPFLCISFLTSFDLTSEFQIAVSWHKSGVKAMKKGSRVTCSQNPVIKEQRARDLETSLTPIHHRYTKSDQIISCNSLVSKRWCG